MPSSSQGLRSILISPSLLPALPQEQQCKPFLLKIPSLASACVPGTCRHVRVQNKLTNNLCTCKEMLSTLKFPEGTNTPVRKLKGLAVTLASLLVLPNQLWACCLLLQLLRVSRHQHQCASSAKAFFLKHSTRNLSFPRRPKTTCCPIYLSLIKDINAFYLFPKAIHLDKWGILCLSAHRQRILQLFLNARKSVCTHSVRC